MFRNLFVLLCVATIIGAFLYAARPEWFSGLTASSQSRPEEFATLKTTLILPQGGKGPPTCTDGTDVRKLVELEEEGVPTRTSPYIMVVNTTAKTIRYYRLTNAVKSAGLRFPIRDVDSKASRVLNTDGPLQLELWITYERELAVDVEFLLPKR
jgi:hypothetical protein